MPNLKILMVNIGFIPESVGGSEFYTYNLSKSLMEKGHKITVFTALEDLTVKRYKVTKTELEGIKVIKVANSWLRARSIYEHFMDSSIDNIFREVVAEEKPDLIHFQHVAYLSGNLLEIAHKMNIPSILTIHDYWYLCFRSRLLKPGGGICVGPQGGSHCATCSNKAEPHPMTVSKYPALIRLINQPVLKTVITNSMDRLPRSLIVRARDVLLGDSGQNGNSQTKNSNFLLEENKFRYEFFKKQFQYPKFVLSPSFHLKKRYEAEGYREIVALPLGYEQPKQSPPLPFNGKLKIAFIGNIVPHKGVTLLLKEMLGCQLEKIEINIHGRDKDSVYFSEVKRVIQQYPTGVVKLHGKYRSDQDLPCIFSQNHLMIFPSIWEENAPLVVREALLYGLPVIASNLGGVPEVIEDGLNGYLFDPFETGSLREKINLILNDSDKLKHITQGARNSKVESMAEHIEKISNIYNCALSDN